MRIVVIVVALMLTHRSEANMSNNFKINLPLRSIIEINRLDTLKIQLLEEYILLEHLYSTLIQSTDDGIEYILAEKIFWNNNVLNIQLKNGLRDSQGNVIDSYDLYLTFKRVLLKGDPTHFKISALLSSENLDDVIRNNQDENRIEIKFKEKQNYIISLFSQIDFALIPRAALDKDLNIIDYALTSGRYSLKNDNKTLLKNINHISFDKSAPDEIIFNTEIIKDKKDLLKFDLLPPWYQFSVNPEVVNSFKKYETIPIKIWKLIFTEKGLLEFKVNERKFIFNLIQSVFDKSVPNRTNQVFHLNSAIALGQKEETEIIKTFLKDQSKVKRKVKIAISRGRLDEWSKRLNDEFIEIVPFDDVKIINECDLVLMNQDIGYDEDVSFVSYSLQSNSFGIYSNEAKNMLKDYMSKNNKSDRVDFVRNLGRHILSNVTLIPLFFEGYATLYKPHLKIDFPKNNSGTPFWKVYRAD